MLKFTDPQSIENPSLPEKQLRQSLTVAAAIGIAAIVLGLVVLTAWVFDVPVIKSIRPGWAAMKANTAIGFILAGAALCLMQGRNASAWAIPVAAVCALATTALGVATLVQYYAQVDLGIDQALFPTADAEFLPGRPAPITAFNFALLGVALLLLCTRTGALRVTAQMFAVPVLTLSYVALLGYGLSASSLYQIPGFVSVAFHTALGQLLLGLGVMTSSPETGITRLLISRGQGSRLARRLILISVLVFPLLGWLRVEAEAAGLITTEMGVALLISITLVVVLSFILLPIEALVRGEVERERLGAAVAASKRAENTFRNVLNAAPDGMLVVNRSGEIVMANTEVEKLFGYTHDEQDHFLANMSHELRTPLTVIIGFIKILMMGSAGPLNDRQEQQASKIETNATHLLALLNDLLDLAKVLSGTEELTLEPVDLRSVVDEVETSLRPLAEKKGLALEIDCPPKLNLGRSRRRTLLQILLNLANNSIKFTDKGTVRVVVEGGAQNNQAVTRIHVIDTGIGIRPEDQDKLFEPFTQLNPNANEAGTGLGLHLSRNLARSLGGDVTFHSLFGQGSTFTLVLQEESDAPAQTRMAS